jgi:hypothetical protein
MWRFAGVGGAGMVRRKIEVDLTQQLLRFVRAFRTPGGDEVQSKP